MPTSKVPAPMGSISGEILVCKDDATMTQVANQVRRLAQDPTIQAVIVTPHWGTEYTHKPSAFQRKWGHALINAGATAVIGAHPHVLQPWETVSTSSGRQGLVMYSLGNFVSNQYKRLATQVSIVLFLTLQHQPGGEATVTGAQYLPIRMSTVNGQKTLVTGDASAIQHVRQILPAQSMVR